jgi:hypothetical protein
MRLLHPSALALTAALFLSSPLDAQQPSPRKAKGVKPAAAAPLHAPEPSTAAVTTGYLQGVAFDSVHSMPLVGAIVQVEGSGRFAISDSLGRFLADSIAPGSYRLVVEHPMLDTIGITLVTPPMAF